MANRKIYELPRLPDEVKALVNDGFYSLYTVNNCAPIAFLLVTNASELYELTSTGEVIANRRFNRLEEVPVGDLVTFPQLESGPVLKINYAG